jgi:hypothetical protein
VPENLKVFKILRSCSSWEDKDLQCSHLNSIMPLMHLMTKQWTPGSEGLCLDCQMTPSQSQSCAFTCKYELPKPNYSTFFDIFCNSNRS